MLMMTPTHESTGSVVTRFVPKKISERIATRARRLAIPREPVPILPGWWLSFLPSEDSEAWAESGALIELDVRIDGETAHLRTAWTALEALIYQAEPRIRIADLDTELLATLIEAYAIAEVEALEAILGVECMIEGIEKCRDHGSLVHLDMGLSLNGSPQPYPAKIYASARVLGLLASAWELRPLQARSHVAPYFIFAARVAVSSISRVSLRHLAVGDALLFDRVAPNSGIVLCVGEHLTAVGQLTETGDVTIGAPFAVHSPFLLGEFQMAENDFETEGAAATALDDATVATLPVRLVFEIGRREVSLDELREMAVGTPISLEKPATSIVDILANGRRIGAGEMVLIGDQLGVKVTRLNGHA